MSAAAAGGMGAAGMGAGGALGRHRARARGAARAACAVRDLTPRGLFARPQEAAGLREPCQKAGGG